jgi:methionine synthase II (cobalamin-independent)
MKQSTDKILTTHTGSFPRPAELQELLYAQERGIWSSHLFNNNAIKR